MPIAPEHVSLIYPGPFDAFLYGRASRDPKMKGRSVGGQLSDGRDLCKANDWPIKREFQDINRSASRYAKRDREEFEEMIEGIEAGECRILVAWEASRYYRDLEVYLRLRNVCMAAGVLLCYNGTVYDLSKRGDRKATAQDALQAEDEAEGIRDRNLRTVRQSAKAGTPHGRIRYGYARRYDPDTGELIEQYPHPERAPIVAEIFERVAAGETEYSILLDLRSRGERTPGNAWDQYHLVDMLRSPTYVGRRVHQGKDFGPATWPGIVDEDLFNAVQRIVSNPARLTTKDWSVRHLLSGIARCGVCASAPHLKVLKNRKYLSYQCHQRFDTVMRKELLDGYVETAVIMWLGSPAAVDAFRSTDSANAAERARTRRDALNAQLTEARQAAGRLRADGKPELSIVALAGLEADLQPQIEECERDMQVSSAPPMLRGLVGRPDVEAVWEGLTISQQRMILRLVVNVRLFKARVRGVRKIEPGRIGLTFIGQPGFISDWRRGPERVLPASGDAVPESR
ncbi:recombinase family protein [Streptomyces sp. ISL-98]|uniref:recombinase family protein n=1 Tax=Streptomyces sp. ISL-98 TaxID=2819192 RepID=UPI001BE927B1|nr:recombinase family protein [Streptomyces sp. ISL-98]MBT2505109.1 recombinase family protein [Streptomyces sp. ISL-98]